MNWGPLTRTVVPISGATPSCPQPRVGMCLTIMWACLLLFLSVKGSAYTFPPSAHFMVAASNPSSRASLAIYLDLMTKHWVLWKGQSLGLDWSPTTSQGILGTLECLLSGNQNVSLVPSSLKKRKHKLSTPEWGDPSGVRMKSTLGMYFWNQ